MPGAARPTLAFIGGKCKAEAGCIWPSSEHGIYVDQNDNVWLSGNSAAADQEARRPGPPTSKAATVSS